MKRLFPVVILSSVLTACIPAPQGGKGTGDSSASGKATAKQEPAKKSARNKNDKGKNTAKNSQEQPTTVSPAGKVKESPYTYDPSKDPRNKEGWKFSRKDPMDPADSKKKPFTIEALYKVKYVGDPQWSPDGMRILFRVTSFKLHKGKSDSNIYMIDADGKNLRQMTRFEGADFQPRWSPDGKEFLFISTRKKGAQVWVI